MNDSLRLEMWTDGAVSTDGEGSFYGGWAAVMKFGQHQREVSGHMPSPTTNNRMEMIAVLMGLRALTRPMPVTIYCDSAYVLNGYTQYLPKWKKNGWVAGRGKDRRPVVNRDIWEALDAEIKKHGVRWQHVKGHSGNEGNERADELAVAAKVAGMAAFVRVELPNVPDSTMALL